jgi:hypothetical protein
MALGPLRTSPWSTRDCAGAAGLSLVEIGPLRQIGHRQGAEGPDRRQAATLAQGDARVGFVGGLGDPIGQLGQRVQPVGDGSIQGPRACVSEGSPRAPRRLRDDGGDYTHRSLCIQPEQSPPSCPTGGVNSGCIPA